MANTTGARLLARARMAARLFPLRLRKLIVIASHAPARAAFFRGLIAPSVELRPLLRAGRFDTVVDVGANAGQFSLLALMDLRPAKIIAFEPLGTAASTYERVLDPKVATLHRVALGAADGELAMYITAASDSSSLLESTAEAVCVSPGTRVVAREHVPVRRLDSLIDEPQLAGLCLLKVDVQGYELEVLKGSGSLLRRFDAILVELSFSELYDGQALASEVTSWLAERGFELRGVANVTESQADFLFRQDTERRI